MPLPNKVGLTVMEMLHQAEEGSQGALYIMGENPMLSDPDANHVRSAPAKAPSSWSCRTSSSPKRRRWPMWCCPAASCAEKLGTFTNSERRVQFVRPAVPPPGEAKPDWWIVGEIAQRMGYDGLSYGSEQEIMAEINRLTPSYAGITYERIGDQGLQWPCPTAEHPGTPILHMRQVQPRPGQLTGRGLEAARRGAG